MKSNKGFTLVELIAVITIISIINGLVVVSIGKIIDINNKKTMKVTVEEILSVVEYEVVENNIDPLSLNGQSASYIINDCLGMNYNSKNYQSIVFYCDECESSDIECPSSKNSCVSYGVTVTGKNDWSGMVISGTKDNLKFE